MAQGGNQGLTWLFKKAHHVRSSNFPRLAVTPATPHWWCFLTAKTHFLTVRWRNLYVSQSEWYVQCTTAEPLLRTPPLRPLGFSYTTNSILCRFCPTIRVSTENSPTYIMSTTLRFGIREKKTRGEDGAENRRGTTKVLAIQVHPYIYRREWGFIPVCRLIFVFSSSPRPFFASPFLPLCWSPRQPFSLANCPPFISTKDKLYTCNPHSQIDAWRRRCRWAGWNEQSFPF